MSNRMQQIREKLMAEFAPLACELIDESSLHIGHPGAAAGGGHYRLQLVSDRFNGHNRIARHRLVYDCLRDMMHSDIHALAITALTPAEASAGKPA